MTKLRAFLKDFLIRHVNLLAAKSRKDYFSGSTFIIVIVVMRCTVHHTQKTATAKYDVHQVVTAYFCKFSTI